MQQSHPRLQVFLEKNAFLISYLACTLLVLYAMLALCNVDLDLWGVLAMGAIIDENFPFFPKTDLFSYTAAGYPWIYHEWGSGFFLYQALKYTGTTGLFWATFVLSALMIGIVWQSGRMCLETLEAPNKQRMLNFFLFSAVAFMGLGYVFYSVTRCQQFSFLGFALTLWVLQRAYLKNATKTLWTLPLVLLLWVNLHGGFILGLVAITAYLLVYAYNRQWGQAQRLGIILLLCLLVSGINPYGFSFWEKLIPSWFMSRGQIWEWNNVLLTSPIFALIYTGFWLLWLGVAYWNWQQKKDNMLLLPLGLFLATGLEGWLHIKLAPYFLISVLCIGFTCQLPPVLYQGGRPDLLKFNYFLLRIGPSLVALSFGFLSVQYILTHPKPFNFAVKGSEPSKLLVRYPLGLSRYMQEQKIRGNVWLNFNWGEYMSWMFYPEVKVSMDGRYETLYPDSLAEDNFEFYTPPYNTERVKQYAATDWIIIDAEQTKVLLGMKKLSGWELCYQDEIAVLYSKTGKCPAHRENYSNATQRLDAFIGNTDRFKLPVTQTQHLRILSK